MQCIVSLQLFLSPERLATRSSDGCVCVWDWRQQTLVTSWKASVQCALQPFEQLT